MKINWKVRLKNKTFWLTAIPAVLLLAQQLLAVFGVTFDVEGLQAALLQIVTAVFAILAVLGIVADPTTAGICDSDTAMTYEEPKQELEAEEDEEGDEMGVE